MLVLGFRGRVGATRENKETSPLPHLAYLLSKIMTFPQSAIVPGEAIRPKQKYHHKTTHIENEPYDKRKMEAPPFYTN
jgi:hypothetical protein